MHDALEALLNTMRWVHAGLGALCMVSGLFALMAPKASGLHPTAGRVFILSLALTFAAILLNIIVAQNVFMLGLGWFALYAALVGWRALLRFQARLSNDPSAFDYLLNGTTALLSLGLAAFGFAVFINSGKVMGLVCVGFGLLGVRLVWEAGQRWKTSPPRSAWLGLHIRMMLGAFSAALTAFLALQFSGHLGRFEWVLWVAPTLILSRFGAYELKRRGLHNEP